MAAVPTACSFLTTEVMMRLANATLNEGLAQVWYGVTLTACSRMLKRYCWGRDHIIQTSSAVYLQH